MPVEKIERCRKIGAKRFENTWEGPKEDLAVLPHRTTEQDRREYQKQNLAGGAFGILIRNRRSNWGERSELRSRPGNGPIERAFSYGLWEMSRQA